MYVLPFSVAITALTKTRNVALVYKKKFKNVWIMFQLSHIVVTVMWGTDITVQ